MGAPELLAAREHERQLYAIALRLCGNPSDARDLVQDTFERSLRTEARPREGALRAWLIAILNNLFIDRCRTKAREARADQSPHDLAEELAAPEPEPSPHWAKITPEQVQAALQQVNEDFRIVYQLHAIEGHSYAAIAERLGIPKATVGTRLIRARRRLKELLLPPEVEAEP